MATYTSHYNLKKPATSDKIRIADFNGNADTIDATMYDNATLGAQLKADIGIVENTNTATHNISAGQYVIWKGSLYTASSAISSGATLSNANLTAVSGGGLNALNDKIEPTGTIVTNGVWSKLGWGTARAIIPYINATNHNFTVTSCKTYIGNSEHDTTITDIFKNKTCIVVRTSDTAIEGYSFEISLTVT